MIFNRLAIGTANWGKEYNGAQVPKDDQKRILDYCQCVGIDTIDTAAAYDVDLGIVNSYFRVIYKLRLNDFAPSHPILCAQKGCPWELMLHSHEEQKDFPTVLAVSLYDPQELYELKSKMELIQVPYSIFDRRFEYLMPDLKKMGAEIHVRSIFLRGKIIEKFEPWQCIAFCLMNPYIDKVIIGVDSYLQFRDNLRMLTRMCGSECGDIDVIDPRRWDNGLEAKPESQDINKCMQCACFEANITDAPQRGSYCGIYSRNKKTCSFVQKEGTTNGLETNFKTNP